MTDASLDLTGRVAIGTGSGRGLGLAHASALAAAGPCVRAAVRTREQGEGGSLILVGSPAGQRGNFGQTNSAKAGIAEMVRTWSMEPAKARITVNAIAPVAATAMTETIAAPQGPEA